MQETIEDAVDNKDMNALEIVKAKSVKNTQNICDGLEKAFKSGTKTTTKTFFVNAPVACILHRVESQNLFFRLLVCIR